MNGRPQELTGCGYVYSRLIAYTQTSIDELIILYGREVYDELERVSELSRVLRIEREIHGDPRESTSGMHLNLRLMELEYVEDEMLLRLASADFMPSDPTHLLLLAWRLEPLSRFEPKYLGRLHAQLASVESARDALAAIEAVQRQHHGSD